MSDSTSELTPVMKKIMALLAKAESTTHEAEAEAYYAKASQLMLKHAIAEADLKPDERPAVTVAHGIELGKGRPNHMLIGAAGSSVGVKAISQFRLGTVSLVGFAAEIEFTQRLYASLLYWSRAIEKSIRPSCASFPLCAKRS